MTYRQINCRHHRTLEIDTARTAFLAIDMQRDFLTTPDGRPNDMARIIPGFAKLLAVMSSWGCKVVHTRESYAADLSDVTEHKASQNYVGRPGPLGKYLIRGEPGCDFVDELQPLQTELIIDQPGFGKFHANGLQEQLQSKGITHLVIAGVTTQCCVHSTLREAVDAGFWCLTVADCCASPQQQWHDAALQLIASENHLFGWICELQDLTNSSESGLS